MSTIARSGPGSGPAVEFKSAITAAVRLVLADPWLVAFFFVPSTAIVIVEPLVLTYQSQAMAGLSQVVPNLLGPPRIVTPRSIVAVPVVATLALLTALGFGFAAGVVVVRADAVIQGEPVSLTDAIRRAGGRSIPVFGYYALAGTVVAVGTAAFVLPGIVAAARLYLGVPAIVLDGSGVVTAGRESWRRTAGRQLPIAGVVVALGVAWAVIAGLPLLGVPVATAVVGTVGLAAATVLYRRPD